MAGCAPPRFSNQQVTSGDINGFLARIPHPRRMIIEKKSSLFAPNPFFVPLL
jgi:hypothetical protein